jgi:hypothetical protein
MFAASTGIGLSGHGEQTRRFFAALQGASGGLPRRNRPRIPYWIEGADLIGRVVNQSGESGR